MSTYAGTPTKSGLLEKAKKCAKQAWSAEANQRKREINALRFQVGEYQWDEAAKAQRAGGVSGAQVTPPRPMLSISKLDQPIQLVLNQARQAKLGVNIHPVSEEANDDTAEVLQGIYRRIERDSNADQARLWALDRATKAGRGVYRVNTKWDEDAPEESFDQEIVIERILHQDSVYFDPSAQKPDFSDGDWAFESLWMTPERFRREFPGAEIQFSTSGDFADLAQDEPDWFEGDGDERKILVIVYWYKQHDLKKLKRKDGAEFKRDIISVKRAWVNANEVLEEEDWNGKYIPLIPVVGRELQPFDSERRWVGMVEPAMDAQKFTNYAASNLAERLGLEPKIPVIGYEGQFTDPGWPFLNVRNLTHLEVPIKPDGAGGVLPLPQRMPVDGTGMSLASEALQLANDWIQSSTGVYDPSLGRQNPRDKSGRAILALQQQADAGNNHFLASLADTSLPYEARVILDLIPHIYDRPGRITRVLGGEDDVKAVMLNAPFKMDPNTGRPMPAQPGEPNQKQYNLTEGTYTVSVSIGKSYQTRMQEGQEEIGAILQADPSLMPLIGSIYFRYRDSPGSKEIAEILKEVREKQYPGLGENKEDGPTPEQMQAKLKAMEAQGQQQQQMLQMAMQKLETEQAKQQAQMFKAQLDHQSKMAELEQRTQESIRKNATSIAVAQIAAEAKGLQTVTESRNEEKALALEHAFTADQAQKQRDQAVEDRHFQAAHEAGMGAAQGQSMTMTRDQSQEQGQETSQEEGADTVPEPQEPAGEA